MGSQASPGWLRPFGKTGITVSAVCMGGAQLGSMPELFGYEVTEDSAIGLVRHVMHGPIRFLDTANRYGGGFTKRSTLERTFAAVEANLPDVFWAEIEALVPEPEHWLDNNPPIVWGPTR